MTQISNVAFSTFRPEYNFFVNVPLFAIRFPTEIPFLASLTEINTVRKIPNHWKLRKPI